MPVLLHLEARNVHRQRQDRYVGELAAGGGKPARNDDEQVGRGEDVGYAHRVRRAHGHAARALCARDERRNVPPRRTIGRRLAGEKRARAARPYTATAVCDGAHMTAVTAPFSLL
jgi:hypothetical protein